MTEDLLVLFRLSICCDKEESTVVRETGSNAWRLTHQWLLCIVIPFHPHQYFSIMGLSTERENDLTERSGTTAELHRESGKERAEYFRLRPCAFGRWKSILSPIARLVSVCLVLAEHK